MDVKVVEEKEKLPEMSLEEKAHLALNSFQIGKKAIDQQLQKLGKKQLLKLMHMLINFPLEDPGTLAEDGMFSSTPTQKIYELIQNNLQNKSLVVQWLNKRVQEEQSKNNNEKEQTNEIS